MKTFTSIFAAFLYLLPTALILISAVYNGPGKTLGYVLVLYVFILMVNSMRMMFGAASDIVRYDTWKDG